MNVGVDIVNINRIDSLIKKNKDRFLNRIFTSEEIDYIEKNYKIETIAGMFASKEAVSKALKTGISKDLGWKDIIILHRDSGEAYINLSEEYINKTGFVGQFDLSISHDTDYAVSFVIKF